MSTYDRIWFDDKQFSELCRFAKENNYRKLFHYLDKSKKQGFKMLCLHHEIEGYICFKIPINKSELADRLQDYILKQYGYKEGSLEL